MKTLPGIEDRDKRFLDPEVRKRWLISAMEFARRFPDLPQPFLTATYRDEVRQNFYYRTYKSQVKGGYSHHQYGLAFDVAFRNHRKGPAIFEKMLYKHFAGIAKYYELDWGGDWPNFLDYGHFQAPISISDIRRGKMPVWKKTV